MSRREWIILELSKSALPIAEIHSYRTDFSTSSSVKSVKLNGGTCGTGNRDIWARLHDYTKESMVTSEVDKNVD